MTSIIYGEIDKGQIPPVAPIDTFNKTELYAHLQQYHRVPYGTTSKSSKDAMIALHEAQHQATDYTEASQYLVSYEDTVSGHKSSTWRDNPDKPASGAPDFCQSSNNIHEHVVVAAHTTDDEREMLAKLQQGTLDKPLTSQECRFLEKVVNNDFAALRTEIQQIAKDVLEERIKGVREEYATKMKDAEKHRKAVVKTVQDINAKILKAIEDAKVAGITISGVSTMSDAATEANVKAVIAGQNEAEAKVRQENSSDLNTALNTLERQRLAAQRMILLAGISTAGQALLDTVPAAKTLMIEAAQQRADRQAAKQIEA